MLTSGFNRFLRIGLSTLLVFCSISSPMAQAQTLWKARAISIPASLPSTDLFSLGSFSSPGRAAQIQPARTTHGLPSIEEITGALAPFGHIKNVLRPASHSPHGVVLLLQDVHHNLEAQNNLEKMVDALVQSQRLSVLGLEGAAGFLDLTRYHAYPFPDVLEKATDFLKKINDITGPGRAALLTSSLKTYGVENKSLYDDNARAYVNAQKEAVEIDALYLEWKKNIEDRKSRIYNPALRVFDQSVSSFRLGTLPLSDYLHVLTSMTSAPLEVDLFLEVLKLETDLNFERVAEERSHFLSALSKKLSKPDMAELAAKGAKLRSGVMGPTGFYQFLSALSERYAVNLDRYASLKDYFQYVALSEQVDIEALSRAVNKMEEVTFKKLAYSPKEWALAQEDRNNFLTGKLIEFSLIPSEWEEVQKQPANPLSPWIENHRKFYSIAMERNEALTSHFLAALQKEDQNFGALVAGGFHANGVAEELLQNNFVVVVASPRLTRVSGMENSLGNFLQEKTPLEILFSGEKLTLSPHPLNLSRAPAVTRAVQGVLRPEAVSLQATKDLAPEAPVEVEETGFSQNGIWTETAKVSGTETGAKVTVEVSPEGDVVSIEEKPITPSLAAHLFARQSGTLNKLVRIALSGGIVAHELGHLVFLPPMTWRADFGPWRILKGLFKGMPWETRGPPALGGLAFNAAIVSSLSVASTLGYFIPSFQFTFSGFLTYMFVSNVLVLILELGLTPFADRLGLENWADIHRWQLGRGLIPAEKLLVAAAKEAHLSERDSEAILRPQRIVRANVTLALDDGSRKDFLGYRVQHNNRKGPFKGGLRFHPNLSLSMVYKLALEMSVKVSLADLTLGGGKGGVRIDPTAHSEAELARTMRAFVRSLFAAQAIGSGIDVPAPDVGTNKLLMAVFVDEFARQKFQRGHWPLPDNHPLKNLLFSKAEMENPWAMAQKDRHYPGSGIETPFADALDSLVTPREAGRVRGVVTGKPVEMGGLEAREAATGNGVTIATIRAAKRYGLVNGTPDHKPLEGVRVAVQGFGNVGFFAAKNLQEKGAIIVAVGELGGVAKNPNGINLEALLKYKLETKDERGRPTIAGFYQAGTQVVDEPGVNALFVEADIVVPAAMEDQITEENADQVQAKIIVEAANGPTTLEADEILSAKGIVVVPDVFANAGGVIVSYYEWLYNLGGLIDEEGEQIQPNNNGAIQKLLEGRMGAAFKVLADISEEKGISLRRAAGIRVLNTLKRKARFKLPPLGSSKRKIGAPQNYEALGAEFVNLFEELQKPEGMAPMEFSHALDALLLNSPLSIHAGQIADLSFGLPKKLNQIRLLTEVIEDPENNFLAGFNRKAQEDNVPVTPLSVRGFVDRFLTGGVQTSLGRAFNQFSFGENDLTLVVFKKEFSTELVEKLVSLSMAFHAGEETPSGRLVFIPEDAAVAEKVRNAGAQAFLLDPQPFIFKRDALGLPSLSLSALEGLLQEKNYLNGASSIRIVSQDRPIVDGLSAASPLFLAVVIQIDAILDSIGIHVRDLNAIGEFERALLSQA